MGPVATVPSPKSHANVYEPTPPEAVPLNVIVCPAVGFDGLKVSWGLTGGPLGLQALRGWISQPE